MHCKLLSALSWWFNKKWILDFAYKYAVSSQLHIPHYFNPQTYDKISLTWTHFLCFGDRICYRRDTQNLGTIEKQKQYKILEVKSVHYGVNGKMNKKVVRPRAFFGGRASLYIYIIVFSKKDNEFNMCVATKFLSMATN